MTLHQALYGMNLKLVPVYNPGLATVDEVDVALVHR